MRSAKNDLQNTRQSQDTTGDQVPFETPWRSHSIVICRNGLEKDNAIATYYCKTHRFDAPVPMHKVSLPYSTLLCASLLYSSLLYSALLLPLLFSSLVFSTLPLLYL